METHRQASHSIRGSGMGHDTRPVTYQPPQQQHQQQHRHSSGSQYYQIPNRPSKRERMPALSGPLYPSLAEIEAIALPTADEVMNAAKSRSSSSRRGASLASPATALQRSNSEASMQSTLSRDTYLTTQSAPVLSRRASRGYDTPPVRLVDNVSVCSNSSTPEHVQSQQRQQSQSQYYPSEQVSERSNHHTAMTRTASRSASAHATLPELWRPTASYYQQPQQQPPPSTSSTSMQSQPQRTTLSSRPPPIPPPTTSNTHHHNKSTTSAGFFGTAPEFTNKKGIHMTTPASSPGAVHVAAGPSFTSSQPGAIHVPPATTPNGSGTSSINRSGHNNTRPATLLSSSNSTITNNTSASLTYSSSSSQTGLTLTTTAPQHPSPVTPVAMTLPPPRFQVEVTPGVNLPLFGAQETVLAVEMGRIRQTKCVICEEELHCIDVADFVLCPQCHAISPIERGMTLKEQLKKSTNHSSSMTPTQNGVALGMNSEEYTAQQARLFRRWASERYGQPHL